MEDLLFCGSVCSVVNSYVRKCLTDDQLQTAGLLQECVMVRDALAYLPDAFTTGDMSMLFVLFVLFVDITCNLCTC